MGSSKSRALPAPTRVSPAPATDQKQHQNNDQYSIHNLSFFLACLILLLYQHDPRQTLSSEKGFISASFLRLSDGNEETARSKRRISRPNGRLRFRQDANRSWLSKPLGKAV